MGRRSSIKRRAAVETAASDTVSENLTVLHRARFVEWGPSAVVATALTDDGSCVAVGRESGAIELWDTETWHCFLVRTTCVQRGCDERLSCSKSVLFCKCYLHVKALYNHHYQCIDELIATSCLFAALLAVSRFKAEEEK